MQLNCDLGEGLDHADKAIMPFIQQANIACGGHAGDTNTMARACSQALIHQVTIGAHPSYPDRTHFGRKSLSLPDDELRKSFVSQVQQLQEVCDKQNTRVRYVKPHGALYNDLLVNPALFELLLSTMHSTFPLMALMIQATPMQASHLAQAKEAGVPIWFEAFADRRYTETGVLQARGIEGAVLEESADVVEQATQLIKHKRVRNCANEWLPVEADSLCVHGDNPVALASVRQISALLANIIKPYSSKGTE